MAGGFRELARDHTNSVPSSMYASWAPSIPIVRDFYLSTGDGTHQVWCSGGWFCPTTTSTSGEPGIVDGLAKEHAQTRGMVAAILQVLQRGLWGRLRWMILGK